jgi:hypothetical protein
LSFVEFAYNNTIHASTQQTPFYANYGHHPKLDLLNPSKIDNLAAAEFATRLLQFKHTMKLQLQEAQDRYTASADLLGKKILCCNLAIKYGFFDTTLRQLNPVISWTIGG